MTMITAAASRALQNQQGSTGKVGTGPYLYLFPTVIVTVVLGLLPVLYQVWMSFTDFQLANIRPDNPPALIGLKNYIGVLTADQGVIKVADFNFWKTLFFNLWWAVSSVFTTIVAGILIAVVLNSQGLWFKRVYRVLFILPMVVPTLVVNTVWRNMFDPQNGAINIALMAIGGFFGLSKEALQIDWLNSIAHPLPWFFPWQAMPVQYFAMMLSNFWRGWPWVTIVATGALQSIPTELYEAAGIDGATSVQKFFNITMPLLRPAIVPAAILSFNWTFNILDIPYFLTGGAPFHETELLVSWLFRLVNEQRLYGVAAAFSVIIFAVSVTLFFITNRFARATEAADS